MSTRNRKPPAWWYDDGTPPVGARLLSGLYRAAIDVRLALYRVGLLRRRRAGVPVVVIGNLIAGGSGKTPLTIATVERLRAAGWTPGVATRGYGRTQPERAQWVDAETNPAIGGDEPVLIARRTGAKVRADRDRAAAARALAAAGCDIVLCDDGLQHYRLHRDIEIEVIDGRRRHGNGLLLPAGPLREPVARGALCDFRVLNVPPSDSGRATPGFGEWPMQLSAGRVLPLLGGRPRVLSEFAGQRVQAVAGIGDPERFFAMLRAHGIAVVPHAFGDHHRYTAADFEFGSDLPVLMTEKDAVKCVGFAGPRHYAVPIDAQLPEAFWIALLDRLSVLRGSPDVH
ncbi:tetraacyldisaccharide 4'-kinase [Cognatiluteimonas telluris]|uniref:tetraacyldisaccharide 4'-kinase n=1 Tax=Cognatiluteimonas telluris TaxID=1104775 RepID=UPI0014088A53|nr:tetraacyldisaccharide 4'-kinase [Lysobacter telluris]